MWKKGHLAKMCYTKTKGTPYGTPSPSAPRKPQQKKPGQRAGYVEIYSENVTDEEVEVSDEEADSPQVCFRSKQMAIILEPTVNGKIELDTGAAVSLVSVKVWTYGLKRSWKSATFY